MGICLSIEVSERDLQSTLMSNVRDVGVDQGELSLIGREVAHNHRDDEGDDQDHPVEGVRDEKLDREVHI
jgi:hypothetical protein